MKTSSSRRRTKPVQASSPARSPRSSRNGSRETPPHNQTGLPTSLLRAIEAAVGHDLSNIRVHPDSTHANQLGAIAYAQGNQIHVAPGQFRPETPGGRRLLGHEVAHVLQQSQGRVEANGHVDGLAINEDPHLEREADRLGARIAQADAKKPIEPDQPISAGPSPVTTMPVADPGDAGHAMANDSIWNPAGVIQRKVSQGSNGRWYSDVTGQSYETREAAETAERGAGSSAAGSSSSSLTSSSTGATSPRLGARRLKKAFDKDPMTTLSDGLGGKSRSFPDVPFDAGGGFIADTKVTRNRTASEIEQERARKQAAAAARGHHYDKEPKSTETTFENKTEYHPAGGIHSNYDASDESKGGSYVRTGVAKKSQRRFGRHGEFAHNRTFDHKPISSTSPSSTPPRRPPPPDSSPPPSPRTSRRVVDQFYRDPEGTLTALANKPSGVPYGHVLPGPSTAGGAASSLGSSSSHASTSGSVPQHAPPTPPGSPPPGHAAPHHAPPPHHAPAPPPPATGSPDAVPGYMRPTESSRRRNRAKADERAAKEKKKPPGH